jgi:hypothetical protein
MSCLTYAVGVTESKNKEIRLGIMSSQFSTSFFLSQWAQEEDKVPAAARRRIELDVVEDPHSREVCVGHNCSLYYNSDSEDYITMGKCARASLCTESRIIKDRLYIKDGNISRTVDCLNYEKQLLNWGSNS